MSRVNKIHQRYDSDCARFAEQLRGYCNRVLQQRDGRAFRIDEYDPVAVNHPGLELPETKDLYDQALRLQACAGRRSLELPGVVLAFIDACRTQSDMSNEHRSSSQACEMLLAMLDDVS